MRAIVSFTQTIEALQEYEEFKSSFDFADTNDMLIFIENLTDLKVKGLVLSLSVLENTTKIEYIIKLVARCILLLFIEGILNLNV